MRGLHFWQKACFAVKTYQQNKMDRKIIFAAPLNSIIEQQSSKRECATLTGMSGVLPEADKVLCSYDALIALLDKNDLSEWLFTLEYVTVVGMLNDCWQ